MSLPQLKHFLSERGVKTTGYKNNELLDIAREAKLQSIPTKTDHYVNEVSCQTLRRTVKEKFTPILCAAILAGKMTYHVSRILRVMMFNFI